MNKVKYGLKNVFAAKLTESASGAISFGTPRKIAGAVNMSLPPAGETTPFFADDIEYFTSITNNGYEGTLEVALVPDWFRTDILNETVDVNDVQVENASVQPERFALLFEFSGDANRTRHVLYNCKAARPNVESATKTNTTEVKTEVLNIVAKPLPDGVVKAKTKDTTPDSVYNGWFDSVYGQTSTAADITPKTATFDKNTSGAAHGDVETAVSNDTATDVQIGGETIGGTNFTIDAGIVKIKKEYLATLTTGAKVFTVVMASEAERTLTVTITDTTP